MTRALRVLALSATALLAACSSDDATGPAEGGGNDVDITVSSGTAPTYSWAGGTAHSVSVTRVSAPTVIVWGVVHLQQALPSPVVHGVVSNGAIATMTTETRLTAGVRYRVSITRQDTKTGWKEFTP